MAKALTDNLVDQLVRTVGKNHVSASSVDAELYSYDASLASGAPEAVVFPGNTKEAAQVVTLAFEAKLPVTPRGFGTNLSGGTAASSGGLVICMSRMNRILSISPKDLLAVVQPGVTNLELQDALAAHNFFFAPDPASQKVATLGGNVGENSGGPHCLKHGVTTNHILGMELVLEHGEIVRLGGPAYDPPGLDLRGLFIGAEGTFGLVTEITVRIMPNPESIITMLAVYDSVHDAAVSVSEIISAGIVPATLEMMDAKIIKAVEDSYSCGYPRDAAAVLIIEVDGPEVGLLTQAERIQEICMANGCREIDKAKNEDERNRLWEGRRGAFGAVARLAPNFHVIDCTVPRTRLPEALIRVEEVAAKYGFEHGNVFHAGDGNMHPLLLFDSRDKSQAEKVHTAGWEIMEACVALGGTISGEHGIGLEKKDAMRLVFSESDLDYQRSLKNILDPENLFNPNKILPDRKKTDGPSFDDTETIFEDSKLAVEGIIQKIKVAAKKKQTVIPVGTGIFLNLSEPHRDEQNLIESAHLENIFEFDQQNQVVTAGSGMTLAALQKKLGQHNQWLPVRPVPGGQKHSLGGIVALGNCGPERTRYGAPRDLLLGLKFINAAGDLISAGGKVIKNVAGYDLTRLMAGSAGTLGFITELTFKTAMIPETCLLTTARGSLEACSKLASDITVSNLEPVFLVAWSENNEDWTLSIGFEGFSDTLEYLLQKCSRLAEGHGLERAKPVGYDVLDGVFARHYDHIFSHPYVIRTGLPLSALNGFAEDLMKMKISGGHYIDFGSGRIMSGMDAITDDTWLAVSESAGRHNGHTSFQKAPADFKGTHAVYAPANAGWELMKKIKAGLDPDNVFTNSGLPILTEAAK